jgi:hypothetical protein
MAYVLTGMGGKYLARFYSPAGKMLKRAAKTPPAAYMMSFILVKGKLPNPTEIKEALSSKSDEFTATREEIKHMLEEVVDLGYLSEGNK